MHGASPRPRSRRGLAALGIGAAFALVPALTSAAAAPSAPAAPGGGGATPVQLLAVNDLHGNLDAVEGPAGSVTRTGPDGKPETVQAGGVPRLATLLDRSRADARATSRGTQSLTVAAGDMIGGSPLLSAAFHDEPTVEALETMGLDVSSVGNHEFDEGPDELLRMKRGGCHPKDGCAVEGKRYDGTSFPYLAANVHRKKESARKPLLPPYWVKKLPNGERIGFIGLTTKDTPSAVSRSMTEDLSFEDEVRTIDRYAEALDRKGVKAVVTLLHEGGDRAGKEFDADCDAKGPASELTGRIKGIASKASPKVDLFVSGHSHEPYVCTVKDPAGQPRKVTQAASFGRTYTDLRLSLDPGGEVVRRSVSARNHVVTRDTPEQPAVSRVVEKWRDRSAKMANEPVGHVSADIPGRGSDAVETPLGDVLTDGQVEATRGAGADLALLNWGGMRADLVHKASGKEGEGVVTYGEAFQVQPFDNPLVTMTLTGEQLVQVLREQFSGTNENSTYPQVLQLSDALRYEADLSRKGADRLLSGTVRVKGKPVDPDGKYRVTVNDFLAQGGNGFPTLREGTERVNSGRDLGAFVDYLKKNTSPANPLARPEANRITFR
ncbi:bifunctional metallophosphatase/5'-nucleotidase [Streptomyces sp. NPDC048172]|uniref:bifunctional metallophosphatase/5'-nucleotidase n=1 Tax=Streptomyces sp. NPDC048172 TaxID=3365505 RepID=UPI0037158FF6